MASKLKQNRTKENSTLCHAIPPGVVKLERNTHEEMALDIPWVPEIFLARFPVSVMNRAQTCPTPESAQEKSLAPKVHLIQNQPQLRSIFKGPALSSNRRGKSMKSFLSRLSYKGFTVFSLLTAGVMQLAI